jgi:putative Mg2+ transporter-C (MgtC) family protein
VTLDLLLRMGLAVLVGALIGAERESRDKAAGFRTMTLISLGSCTFTILSIRIGGAANAARIAAQIVSGVGFLGAGAIMRDGSKVSGLTTAATVWLTASLGMGLGAGYVALSLVATGMTALVLLLFPFFEHQIDRRRESTAYQLTCGSRDIVERLKQEMKASGLTVTSQIVTRTGEVFCLSIEAVGNQSRHEVLSNQWLSDAEVTSVSC